MSAELHLYITAEQHQTAQHVLGRGTESYEVRIVAEVA